MRATAVRPRVWLRRARRLGAALGAITLAVALVCGALRSGASLFFCAGMGSLAERPCCAAAHDDPADDAQAAAAAPASGAAAAAAAEDDACCARLALAKVPGATPRAPTPRADAPLTAVIPTTTARLAVRASAPPASPRTTARLLAGSPPPTARERCAVHSVFVI